MPSPPTKVAAQSGSTLATAATNKAETPQTLPSGPRTKKLSPSKAAASWCNRRRWFGYVWTAITTAISIYTGYEHFKPKVAIESGVAIDEADPLQTLFRIRASGPWTVDNVTVKCVASTNTIGHLTLGSNVIQQGPDSVPTGQKPLPHLPPDAPVTRDCAAGLSSNVIRLSPYDPTSLRLWIIVEFDWPYIHYRDKQRAFFTARRLYNGKAVLVPDFDDRPPGNI